MLIKKISWLQPYWVCHMIHELISYSLAFTEKSLAKTLFALCLEYARIIHKPGSPVLSYKQFPLCIDKMVCDSKQCNQYM